MVDVDLHDIAVDVSDLIAVDTQALGSLKLRSMLRSGDMFFFLLSIMDHFKLSKFTVTVGDVVSPVLTEFINDVISCII